MSVDVVEQPVVGLADDGQRPVEPVAALLYLSLDQSVAHHADAVGVGQPDRGGEFAGFADPVQTGEFAAAVEPVGAREDGLGPDVAMRDEDGHSGVDGREVRSRRW